MKAAFFDRDGTLIEDVGYLASVEQVVLIPSMLQICFALQQVGYILCVVTNQSGVARGFFEEIVVMQVHERMQQLFAKHGVRLGPCFYCPHHPVAGNDPKYTKICSCRKPAPGLLFRAAEEYSISLSDSLMIGDKACDVQAGDAAGCQSFFVQDIARSPQSWLQHIQRIS